MGARSHFATLSDKITFALSSRAMHTDKTMRAILKKANGRRRTTQVILDSWVT